MEDNLILNSKSIVDSAIKCGIYRGDALSPLLFCIAFNPLSALLDKITYAYQFKSGATFNHLHYMDDIKLYATNKQDIESLIHLSNIGVLFGLAKCGQVIVNKGKVKSTRVISLPVSQKNRAHSPMSAGKQKVTC